MNTLRFRACAGLDDAVELEARNDPDDRGMNGGGIAFAQIARLGTLLLATFLLHAATRLSAGGVQAPILVGFAVALLLPQLIERVGSPPVRRRRAFA
jgi:hypothetical protein